MRDVTVGGMEGEGGIADGRGGPGVTTPAERVEEAVGVATGAVALGACARGVLQAASNTANPPRRKAVPLELGDGTAASIATGQIVPVQNVLLAETVAEQHGLALARMAGASPSGGKIDQTDGEIFDLHTHLAQLVQQRARIVARTGRPRVA